MTGFLIYPLGVALFVAVMCSIGVRSIPSSSRRSRRGFRCYLVLAATFAGVGVLMLWMLDSPLVAAPWFLYLPVLTVHWFWKPRAPKTVPAPATEVPAERAVPWTRSELASALTAVASEVAAGRVDQHQVMLAMANLISQLATHELTDDDDVAFDEFHCPRCSEVSESLSWANEHIRSAHPDLFYSGYRVEDHLTDTATETGELR